MATSQRRILLVLFVAVLLIFSRSHLLFAQKAVNGNGAGSTDVVGDQEGENDLDADFEEEDEKIEVKKVVKKSKKYRKSKSKLSPQQKKQKLIVRELKRFENAKKSISNREKKAKKILKKAERDRKKEIIKHDKRIEEIENMEFD